jgi:hypothetical protein
MERAEVRVGRAISRRQPVVRPSEMIEIRISQDELKTLLEEEEATVEVVKI